MRIETGEHLSDAEFDQYQADFIFDVIVKELSWQIVETILAYLHDTNARHVDQLMNAFEYENAAKINWTLYFEIREQFKSDFNIWRRPDLFVITPQQIRVTDTQLTLFEIKHNLTANEANERLGFSSNRHKARRQAIKRVADNWLHQKVGGGGIRSRYLVRYGTKQGIRRYKEFLNEKVFKNLDFYNFIYQRHAKTFPVGSDPYVYFENFRNTANKIAAKAFQKSWAGKKFAESWLHDRKIQT